MQIPTDLQISDLGDCQFVLKCTLSEDIFYCNGIASLITFISGYYSEEPEDSEENAEEESDA